MQRGMTNTLVNMTINMEVLVVFGFSKHKVSGTAFTPAISY